MGNAPEVVFIFDADALVQIFVAGQQNLLRLLREKFGVRSYIMMEVEVELRWNRKFSGLIKPQLDKALRSGWIKLLSSGDLEELASSDGPSISLSDIRELGDEYSLYVQRGEAYTHAAAVLLDSPSVSNDFKAIRVLEANAKALPPTILRSFDLFGFLYTEKFLSESEAEQIRSSLNARSEWIPASMKNTTFVDGLGAMRCRLSTSLAVSSSGKIWSDVFYLPRIVE